MMWLKRFGKLLWGLLAGIVGLCLLGLFGLVLVLWRPQFLVNESNLRWVAREVLSPRGIQLEFESFALDWERRTFWKGVLRVRSKNLQLATPELQASTSWLDAQAMLDLDPRRPRLMVLGPALVERGRLHVNLEPQLAPKPSSTAWHAWIEGLYVAGIRLKVDELSVRRGETLRIETRGTLSLTQSLISRVFSLNTQLEQNQLIVSPMVKLKAPLLAGQARFHWSPERFALTSLGPFRIQGDQLHLSLTEEASSGGQPSEHSWRDWLAWVSRLYVQPLAIDWKDFRITRANKLLVGGRLHGDISHPTLQSWKGRIELQALQGLKADHAQFDIDVLVPPRPQRWPVAVTARSNAALHSLGRFTLDTRLNLSGLEQGSFNLRAHHQGQGRDVKARLEGTLRNRRFEVALEGQLGGLSEILRRVTMNPCRLSGELEETQALKASLACEVELVRRTADDPAPLKAMLPASARWKITGPLNIPKFDATSRFSVPLDIVLLPLENPLYRLTSRTSVVLRGALNGPQQGIDSTIDLDTSLVFQKFQNIVRHYQQGDFTIPAPFHTLDGSVRCDLKGRIQTRGGIIDLPLRCATELDSNTQTLWLTAAGVIQKRPDQKPLIKVATVLDKVTFELPRVSLNDSVPQLLPDARIQKGFVASPAPVEAQPLPVMLDLSFRTPDGRPLTLVSPNLQEPIPIRIDLSLTGDRIKPSGTIRVTDYDVRFFKKKAFVDHLGLVFNPEDGQTELDGLIVFRDPDFRIELRLAGTVERPFYVLESQPPRPSTELLSMILFGGSADALDEENLRSVEETRAAMVDGAIGLLSMYYLAATPVESVGYNPHTGMFRAKVRLGQTLSLMVGSDIEGDQQSIGLRKRLTENWSFETTAMTDEETQKNQGVAMFRWGRRY